MGVAGKGVGKMGEHGVVGAKEQSQERARYLTARPLAIRAKGEGSIAREGAKFRVRLPAPARTNLGLFDSVEAAQERLASALQSLGLGERAESAMTFGEWMTRELARREVERLRNARGDRWQVEAHVLPDAIAQVPLALLDGNVADARAFLGRLLCKGGGGRGWRGKRVRKALSPRTVRNILTVARVGCEKAVEDGLMRSNPFAAVKVPRSVASVETEETWTIWEPKEQLAILRSADQNEHDMLGTMVRVALGTGLRKGELLALTWSDVRLSGPSPMLMIRSGKPQRRKQGASDLPTAGPTKGGRVRRVPLFGIALSAMRHWVEGVGAEGEVEDVDRRAIEHPPVGVEAKAGEHGPAGPAAQDPIAVADLVVQKPESGVFVASQDKMTGGGVLGAKGEKRVHEMEPTRPVFPGRGGDFRVKVPVGAFVAAQRAAGLERIGDWHDLRHTCATSLLEGWWGVAWRLEDVQRLLGHRSRTTTEKYCHLRGDAVFRAAAGLGLRPAGPEEFMAKQGGR
jgi:integrase